MGRKKAPLRPIFEYQLLFSIICRMLAKVEAKKYNPVNITPEHLFRPPSSCVHAELLYLIQQLSQCLEGKSKDRQLRIGTELEIFFFDSSSDPYESLRFYGTSDINPNYSKRHADKMRRIANFTEQLHFKRPKSFLPSGSMGHVFFEFRTAPQSASKYLDTISSLGEELRKKCGILEVSPVVHSQHLHVSLIDESANELIPESAIARGVFSRVNALVLLPEEWEDYRDMSPMWQRTNGISPNGLLRDVRHSEFRKLSSEYAHDPVLNLLLSLRTMYGGCVDASNITFLRDSDSHKEAVRVMKEDKELACFFGQATLSTLSHIASQYSAVSKRQITIDQIAVK